MAKISIQDLKKIKERERGKMVLRDGQYRAKITVHMGTCGIAAGARDVMGVFRDLIAQKELDDVILTNSGCAGLCAKEPMITVELADQSPVKYIKVDKSKAARIFEEHVIGGKAVEDYALARGSETTAT
ncbi:MAG: (2Fe-2S) ferredoxin domain-containing protein [Desulfomonile tiedjei]|uniref:(2Fe-2S) ferredoxin domain-containing protein n=1 Tax=Desulfomonile tiedjei TaxID=2358 RepID=A0A9D6Z5G7_9BACT|nr:(2Fe-2S) ferredoxin domain-containing protein [Desulfomonile tiedjei]